MIFSSFGSGSLIMGHPVVQWLFIQSKET